MDVSGQTVGTTHFTTSVKDVVLLELEAGWVLELVWLFWRTDSSLVRATI